jgi:hypothetical protein
VLYDIANFCTPLCDIVGTFRSPGKRREAISVMFYLTDRKMANFAVKNNRQSSFSLMYNKEGFRERKSK